MVVRLLDVQTERAYIDRRLESLASEAWRGYLKDGRGFVSVEDFPGACPSETYVAGNSERLGRIVETYDPRREFVVVFEWAEERDDARAYTVACLPTPPRACLSNRAN